MGYKYLPTNNTGVRRPRGGEYLVSDDPYVRDRYYAYLKHRSQKVFRGETYNLSWKDWDRLWTPELWALRGRGVNSVQMYRISTDLPWCEPNVEICSRKNRGCFVKYD